MTDMVLQEFQFLATKIKIWVPELASVQQLHHSNTGSQFPYWARVWPSSLGMIQFLEQHPIYIQGKKVLEIAAGIGLPSFYAASQAHSVKCSDFMEEAVKLMEYNIQYNHLQNIEAVCLDWNHIPPHLIPETVLISDVNYQADNFKALFDCITIILEKGSTIILATPQRLVGRAFVELILPWSILNEVLSIGESTNQILINILVLKL
jgi:methyltransferase-like protein 23